MNKKTKSRRAYTPEFRQQLIELVRAGRTPAELSREFGPTAQAISNWALQEQRDRELGAGGGALTQAEREELKRLRREVKSWKQQCDILSKATAWFAVKHGKTSTPSTSS